MQPAKLHQRLALNAGESGMGVGAPSKERQHQTFMKIGIHRWRPLPAKGAGPVTNHRAASPASSTRPAPHSLQIPQPFARLNKVFRPSRTYPAPRQTGSSRRMPALSVVLVTRNRKDEVASLLSDLQAMARGKGDEVVVVDNASTDGTVALVRERFPGAKVIAFEANRGAPAARNAAAVVTSGEVMVFLDDDVRVDDPLFLAKIRLAFEAQADLSVAAFRIVDPATGRSRSFEIPRRRKDLEMEGCETSYFIAAGCAIRRSAYRSVGGMDESLIYGFEELDFSYRAVSLGLRIFYR